MNDPLSIPPISRCIEIFGQSEGVAIHKELGSSEFRAANSLHDQLLFLQRIRPHLTIKKITSFLGICIKRYYKALKNDDTGEPAKVKLPQHQLLTDEEEMLIIEKIHEMQLLFDCWTGKDIRNYASHIYEKRTLITKVFTRDWIHDFKNRHKDEIDKVSADSLEENRADISLDEVNRYIDEVEQMMKDPPNPFLLINFDEIGFGRRPEKGKKKKVYVFKQCEVKPFFREEVDQHHISVVVGVSAACCDIMPLFISTRKHLDPDINETFFLRRANYYYTSKGYANTDSTVFWIENNLEPYVQFVRKIIGEELRCVVIADGLKAHFNERAIEALNHIGNIQIIAIPPHSSHITQVLDLTIFNSFKRCYDSILDSREFKSAFTKKLMKIKKAYFSTVLDELILSGWKRAGFDIILTQGDISNYTFSDRFKQFLRAAAQHQDIRQFE